MFSSRIDEDAARGFFEVFQKVGAPGLDKHPATNQEVIDIKNSGSFRHKSLEEKLNHIDMVSNDKVWRIESNDINKAMQTIAVVAFLHHRAIGDELGMSLQDLFMQLVNMHNKNHS